jgi:hypothetical protein
MGRPMSDMKPLGRLQNCNEKAILEKSRQVQHFRHHLHARFQSATWHCDFALSNINSDYTVRFCMRFLLLSWLLKMQSILRCF